MNNKFRYFGFSLAETLIALGILTVGMIFIAGVFPVGIYFTNVSIDRTMAAAVADEAFAKIKLYANSADGSQSLNICRLENDEMTDFNDWYDLSFGLSYKELTANDFAYPSLSSMNADNKHYYWSAICRLLQKDINCDPVLETNRLVQVTVFVSRRAGTASKYYNYDFSERVDFPVPVKIEVRTVARDNELEIESGFEGLVNNGYTIVDDETGKIYRVLERYKTAGSQRIILLDKNWTGGDGDIWAVPPPIQPGTNPSAVPKRVSGQYPCIGVYQKIIRF